MNKKVAFYTLGCKVNQYETNMMTNLFKKAGYDIVEYTDNADVYVINTCTVTNMSERKSRQILRRAKEINPNSILCVVGCYVQVAKEELENLPEIDILLGTNDRKNIVKYVEEYQNTRFEAVEDIMKKQEYLEWGGTAYSAHERAEIKIQDGCDRFCTYCIIPYARGPVRSRKIEDIYNEILKLAQNGVKEIVITGIHISSYGKDFKDGTTLIDVLEKVNSIDGIERIRLGSLEPLIITEEFVERLKKLDKICNHFHLSLQSGCDATLARMNRRYSTEDFKKIVNILRNNIKDVALTTDVIVGFPGETEEEFNQTVKFLSDIKFSKMHIFKYSPRRGTKAIDFPNQVDGNIKTQRSDVLIQMSDKNEKEFAEKYIGKEIEVLFENEEMGHTTNYISVIDETKSQQAGTIKCVIPKLYKNGSLYI